MHVFGTLSCKSTAIFLFDFDIFLYNSTVVFVIDLPLTRGLAGCSSHILMAAFCPQTNLGKSTSVHEPMLLTNSLTNLRYVKRMLLSASEHIFILLYYIFTTVSNIFGKNTVYYMYEYCRLLTVQAKRYLFL
jgi:hypothetical protein